MFLQQNMVKYYVIKNICFKCRNEEIIKFKRRYIRDKLDEYLSSNIWYSCYYIDYELYENKILVYICNTGLNVLVLKLEQVVIIN